MPEHVQYSTHIYKSIDGLDIAADVYPAESLQGRPVILWIHGGALIGGCRDGINPWQVEMYVNAGYNVVSIDYRLAPETKLPAILDDLKDAWRWLHGNMADLFGAGDLPVAVIGHSAGGYLTLMAGVHLTPRPVCLVSFYGYGDVARKWYSRPDPFYCQQPEIPEEEARSGVGAAPLSCGKGPERGTFYLYCRQKGIWPQEVAGHDPDTQPEEFDPYCPVRNVTKDYPPTLFLHGDADTDVPHEQSVMMSDELTRAGVENELVTINDGAHGFDGFGLDDVRVEEAFKKVMTFLKRH